MPPADPTIALGIRPPESPVVGGAGGPLGMVESFARIQNELNTARLFNQTFQARQALGEMMATSPDLDTFNQRATQSPWTAFAPEVLRSSIENSKTLADLANTRQQGRESALNFTLRSSAAGLVDPTQRFKTADAVSRLADPQYRDAVRSAASSLIEAWGDPTNAATGGRAGYNMRASAGLLGAGFTPESLRTTLGGPEMVNLGGQIQPTFMPSTGAVAAGVAPVPLGAPMAMSPAPRVEVAPVGPGGAPAAVQLGGAGGAGGVGAPIPVGGGMMANPLLPAAPATRLAPPGIAPLGGLSATGQTYAAHRGAVMSDYEKDLDSLVSNETSVLNTISEARSAMQQIRTGGGASTYARLAQTAQAFGASNDLVDKIAGGNLAATQEFEKLMLSTTMGQIRNALRGIGSSRLNEQEFNAFQKNNPNLQTDPRAIEKIFDFWTRMSNRDYMEQQHLNDAKGRPGFDISKWPSQWQRLQRERGIVQPSTAAVGSQEGPAASRRWVIKDGQLVPAGGK